MNTRVMMIGCVVVTLLVSSCGGQDKTLAKGASVESPPDEVLLVSDTVRMAPISQHHRSSAMHSVVRPPRPTPPVRPMSTRSSSGTTRGFTHIPTATSVRPTRSPASVITLLDEVFTQCDAICLKHNATKIKTIGDSYMVFAFDADGTTSVVNAVRTAIDMGKLQHDIIQCRIGMHSGPVTADVIGKERMHYDVWGDTVNVASRMESSGQAGRVHVSEAFAKSLNRIHEINGYMVEVREEVEIKDKGAVVT